MSKINIPPITGGYNLSRINDAFQTIEEHLNDKVLYRDVPEGEPNQMVNDLDMNGKRIYNLPEPQLEHEPARYAEVKEVMEVIPDLQQLRDDVTDVKNRQDSVDSKLEEIEELADRATEAVQELVKYQGIESQYTGDGSTTSFSIGEVDYTPELIVVEVNGELADESKYALVNGEVVFNTAPQDGDAINILVAPEIRTLNDASNVLIETREHGTWLLDDFVQELPQITEPTGDEPVGGLNSYSKLKAYAGAATRMKVQDPTGMHWWVRKVSGVDDWGLTGLVDALGRHWVRDKTPYIDLRWGVVGDVASNTTVLQAAIDAAARLGVRLVLPRGDFAIDLDGITIPDGVTIEGQGVDVSRLVGPDPIDAPLAADADKSVLYSNKTKNVTLRNFTIVNGNRGKGIFARGCEDWIIEDVHVDGCTFGYWVGESEDGEGSKRIKLIRPRVSNTRYWGIYLRGYELTDAERKTQDILVQDPYCYRVSMAGIVLSEGNVRDVRIIRPRAKDCNLHMHFEGVSNLYVEDPRDSGIGKQPWMLPANSEYPFENWSMYAIFAEDVTVVGGDMVQTVYLSGAAGDGLNHHGHQVRCKNLKFLGVKAKDWVFEGVGSAPDAQQNIFENIDIIDCESSGVLIYQQPTDQPSAYIRNLNVRGGRSFTSNRAASGAGTKVFASILRGIDISISSHLTYNACARINAFNKTVFKDNRFIGGTDQTYTLLNGFYGGVPDDANWLDFSGNSFDVAGGVVVGENAVRIRNFSYVKCLGNVLNGGLAVNYLIDFENIHRVEYAEGLSNAALVENYRETNVSNFKTAFA